MAGIANVVQDRKLNLSLDITRREQLGKSEQEQEDADWVVVEFEAMTQPATSHRQRVRVQVDRFEEDGKRDQLTQTSQLINRGIQALQPDVIDIPNPTERDGNDDEGMEFIWLSEVDDEMGLNESTEEKGKFQEEMHFSPGQFARNEQVEDLSQLESEGSLSPVQDSATQQENEREKGPGSMASARYSSGDVQPEPVERDGREEQMKPAKDVPIKTYFMSTFQLNETQYQEVKVNPPFSIPLCLNPA